MKVIFQHRRHWEADKREVLTKIYTVNTTNFRAQFIIFSTASLRLH